MWWYPSKFRCYHVCNPSYEYFHFGAAAILDFSTSGLVVRSYTSPRISVRLLELENMVVSVEILLISRLQAELCIIPLRTGRHLGFFHFRFGRTVVH